MRQLRVKVFEEQEVFRRGIVACLRDDDGMEVAVASPPLTIEDLDVAVASAGTWASVPFGCPIVLCSDSEADHARMGSDAGVFAILPRRTLEPEQLNAAVRAAAAHLHVEPSSARRNVLDDRAISVLEMIASGMGTKEVSQQLGYSERTIKGVLANLQHELGTRTRAQTVAVAMRELLI